MSVHWFPGLGLNSLSQALGLKELLRSCSGSFWDPRIPGLVPLRFARGHVVGHVGVPLLQARKLV